MVSPVCKLDASIKVRDLYRERVALDREYALKLQALARRASEKKAKLTASLVLGNEPTKVWDENALRKRSVHVYIPANILTPHYPVLWTTLMLRSSPL